MWVIHRSIVSLDLLIDGSSLAACILLSLRNACFFRNKHILFVGFSNFKLPKDDVIVLSAYTMRGVIGVGYNYFALQVHFD